MATELRKLIWEQGRFWCSSHNGIRYTFEEYAHLVETFHGFAAPGVVLGGKMVHTAMEYLPSGTLFDAMCETSNCLPDAVQLLTPCTTGNGWLKIVGFGRFALVLYDKVEGHGVRVSLDPRRLEPRQEIRTWLMGTKPKADQDSAMLMEQIRQAGADIFRVQGVRMQPEFLSKVRLGDKSLCPLCGESYPGKHGTLCRGCQEGAPYIAFDDGAKAEKGPHMKAVPLAEAPGHRLLHDMTQIVPGQSKGPVFRKGQTITAGDLCRLQTMGRNYLYVDDSEAPGDQWIHENDAALAFAERMAGPGVSYAVPPKEGKITFHAEMDGMLLVDQRHLALFNFVPGVICATRKNYSLIHKGTSLAGTRAIPLFLSRNDLERALSILAGAPLFQVIPLRKAKVGILVTGTEVFQGLIQDRFIPIIQAKVEALSSRVVKTLIVPDDRETIRKAVLEMIDSEVDLLVTTAGLSVDPEDITRQGLLDAGIEDMLYGVPVLPGAMTLLARIGRVQVMGVPACALYFKSTAFDLLLPRLLAHIPVTQWDLAELGHGGFCLECQTCTFPKCPFGK
jgi:formylmethanofuran dehydrogenase subunit E